MITNNSSSADQPALCSWCYGQTDDSSALWKVGRVRSRAKPWPASNRWSCSTCTPLVAAHDTDGLVARAVLMGPAHGNHYSGLSMTDVLDAFERVDAAIERRITWSYAGAAG